MAISIVFYFIAEINILVLNLRMAMEEIISQLKLSIEDEIFSRSEKNQ